MAMRVAVGCDHAGYSLKGLVVDFLKEKGHEVVDEGTFSDESCDYPDFALRVATKVARGEVDRGILICATGTGMAMVANKVPGVRAAVANDIYTARYSRLHNDANVLAMGARIIGPGLALAVLETWMGTEFEGGRHERRLEKMSCIERGERDGGI